MQNPVFFLLILFSTIAYSQTPEDHYSELNLDSIFHESIGTFVLYDLQNDSYHVYNRDRAKQKFAVHSTSKILWSIIGLEAGLVTNETDIVKWDSVKYPKNPTNPTGFNQDQTIVTALKYSVNWYYLELLKLMSPELIEQDELKAGKLRYEYGFRVLKAMNLIE